MSSQHNSRESRPLKNSMTEKSSQLHVFDNRTICSPNISTFSGVFYAVKMKWWFTGARAPRYVVGALVARDVHTSTIVVHLLLGMYTLAQYWCTCC